MSHWVELGGFCLAYDKRNTFIEVTTTLGLRTADGNPVRAPGSDKLLSELQIGQSWVARSRSFTLVIQMTGIRQGPEHTGHGGLQWLYQLVAESELWRQLDLKITPSTLIKDSGKEGSLWLNLQHQRADGTARKGRSHNLYQDACLTDLRPPTDIQALLPEQLVLDICFHTSNPQSKNQRFGATASTQTLCNADHGDDAMLYENAEEVDIVDRHKDGRDQPYSSQTAASQQEDRFTRPTSDCHFIAAAVDAALRSAIARKPTLPQGGIRLHHDMRQAYLQEIAPSIAAPGYLAAMFERSCLLPTLGRTVTAMRKRSAQRVLLTNQIPTLVQTCLAISIPDQQLAVTRLWSLVHKKMAETACARPLKRMKSKQLSPVDEDASQTIFASTHVTTLSHIVPSMHESSLDWTADRSLLSTADVAPDQPTPAASKCSLHSEGPGPGDGPCSMYAISDEDLLEEVEGGDVAHSVAQAPETFLDEDLPDELMLDAIPERDASPFPYLTVGIEALAGNPILMKDSIVDTILIAPSVGTPTADQRRHGRNRHASECDPEPTLVEEDHDEDLFSDYDYADSCISSQTSTYSASLSAYTAGSMPGLRPPDSSSALHAVEDDMLSLVSNDIDLLEVE